MKDIKTVYVVCWGNASQDDDGNSAAYSGVHGIYAFEDDAKKGLADCKEEILKELTEDPNLAEEDKQEIKDTVQVYGSVQDDFFEIDYETGGIPCEIYIHTVKKELMI
jgi:hypothetical protein